MRCINVLNYALALNRNDAHEVLTELECLSSPCEDLKLVCYE